MVIVEYPAPEDVVNQFKASGPRWQSRIDAALKEWLDARPGKP